MNPLSCLMRFSGEQAFSQIAAASFYKPTVGLYLMKKKLLPLQSSLSYAPAVRPVIFLRAFAVHIPQGPLSHLRPACPQAKALGDLVIDPASGPDLLRRGRSCYRIQPQV